jgi:hypothetical protein
VRLEEKSVSKNLAIPITGYIKAGSSKLYYEITGEGYPLVFVHDGLVDSRIWDEQVPFF